MVSRRVPGGPGRWLNDLLPPSRNSHAHHPFLGAAGHATTVGAAVSAQAAWQIAYPAQSPQPDYQWAAAFDEVRGEALLMFPRSGQAPRGWRSGRHHVVPAQTGCCPLIAPHASMVWDAGRQRAVLFGGIWWGGPWGKALYTRTCGSGMAARGRKVRYLHRPCLRRATPRPLPTTAPVDSQCRSAATTATTRGNGMAWRAPSAHLPCIRPPC